MFDIYIIVSGFGTPKEYFNCMTRNLIINNIDSLVTFYEFNIDKNVDHFTKLYEFIRMYRKNKNIRHITIIAFSVGCNLITSNINITDEIYNRLYLLDPPLPLDKDYQYLYKSPLKYTVLFYLANMSSIVRFVFNYMLRIFENKSTPYIVNDYILRASYQNIIYSISKYYFNPLRSKNINAKTIYTKNSKFNKIGKVFFDIDYSYRFQFIEGNHHIFNKKNIDIIL